MEEQGFSMRVIRNEKGEYTPPEGTRYEVTCLTAKITPEGFLRFLGMESEEKQALMDALNPFAKTKA